MKFTLFEDENFQGQQLQFEITNYTENALHSLSNTDIHDKVSSVKWELPENVIITLCEHDDGTGRQYHFGRGTGEDSSTHGPDNFKDCASSWRWTTTDGHISTIEAFNRISTEHKGDKLPANEIKIRGGHLQGVGHLSNQILAVSASGKNFSQIFLFEWMPIIGHGRSRLIKTYILGNKTLNHAGAFQVCDNVLAIGVEDFNNRKKSEVLFFDVRNPLKFKELHHLKIKRRSRRKEVKTAGAVGLMRRKDNYLLIVGSWDSNTIEFYFSTSLDLLDKDYDFDYYGRWKKEQLKGSAGIDENWASYQSLNLVSFDENEIYIIAGHRATLPRRDWIDLYKVDLSDQSNIVLTKAANRNLQCKDGASFRHAGGIIIEGSNNLHAFCTERNADYYINSNLFEGANGIGGLSDFVPQYIVNRRSMETHSLAAPCKWVERMSEKNKAYVETKPTFANWCDHCFPALANG